MDTSSMGSRLRRLLAGPDLPPLEVREEGVGYFMLFLLTLLNIVDAFNLNVVWPM